MIITLTGSNDFMLRQELRRLRQKFIEAYTDMGLENYDGQEVDPTQLPSILQALPFLVEKRCIIFRQPSAQKAVQEALEQLLGTVTNTTELIIVEPKLDKRTSYYKALQKQTDFREYKELDERGLARWLIEQAKLENATLSQADAHYLVQRVGTNQLMLANELQKLIDYQSAITKQTINEMTEPNPQSSVFDLLDAALAGNKQKTTQLYHEQRQQKVEPLAIMGMLAWQLHVIALLKTAGERSQTEVASQAKVSPYVLSKSQSIARKISLTDIKNWVHDGAQLDIRLKRQPIDADEAMLNYLLSFSS